MHAPWPPSSSSPAGIPERSLLLLGCTSPGCGTASGSWRAFRYQSTSTNPHLVPAVVQEKQERKQSSGSIHSYSSQHWTLFTSVITHNWQTLSQPRLYKREELQAGWRQGRLRSLRPPALVRHEGTASMVMLPLAIVTAAGQWTAAMRRAIACRLSTSARPSPARWRPVQPSDPPQRGGSASSRASRAGSAASVRSRPCQAPLRSLLQHQQQLARQLDPEPAAWDGEADGRWAMLRCGGGWGGGGTSAAATPPEVG